MDSALMVEKMYYIVDERGNYYCLNGEDQLIVSQNRDRADLFAFKEANKRIGSGKKMRFYSILPADPGTSEGIEALEDTVEDHFCEENPNEERNVNFLNDTKQDVEMKEQNVKEVQYVYDMEQLNWEEFLTHLCFVLSGLGDYQKKLKDDLSKTDMCIGDLLHYLELYDLNEAEYGRTAKMLKEYREKRRVIKDHCNIAEWFQNAVGTKANLAKVKTVLKQVDNLSKRMYTPRMLPEVFEYATMEDKGSKEREEFLETYSERREGEDMITANPVRRETKFDAGKNDWLRMAEEQAQFFAEAKQYMCNLQISLQEMDEEIESILIEMEETNYNAAEGYKTLKKLQTLRNERKRVMNELESVQTITGCFACDEMRDAYLYCEERIREIIG